MAALTALAADRAPDQGHFDPQMNPRAGEPHRFDLPLEIPREHPLVRSSGRDEGGQEEDQGEETARPWRESHSGKSTRGDGDHSRR
jgi:hypothetical protein